MERWTKLASCLVFTLTLLKPGSGFIFKKSASDLDMDSSDVSHLKRRYWNDDIQPCIEKFCMRYLGQKVYINCLQHYCPGSLLAVPRDLESASLFPSDHILGDTELCSEDFLTNGGLNGNCKGGDCVANTNARSQQENFLFSRGSDLQASALKHHVFQLCREAMCNHVSGMEHAQCIQEKCCGQGSTMEAAGKPKENSSTDRFHLSRKRRINDEVSQCIQSYCSGKNSSQRLLCIIAYCNRM